jgi:hypothetical protein
MRLDAIPKLRNGLKSTSTSSYVRATEMYTSSGRWGKHLVEIWNSWESRFNIEYRPHYFGYAHRSVLTEKGRR